jgi:hypothetical protein
MKTTLIILIAVLGVLRAGGETPPELGRLQEQ